MVDSYSTRKVLTEFDVEEVGGLPSVKERVALESVSSMEAIDC